jgi:hypothetical protein
MRTEELAGADLDLWVSEQKQGGANMTRRPSMLSLSGLALAGWLGLGINGASAQSLYVETYPEPFPVIAPYPVEVAPRYVVPPAVVAPPPIVGERTIVVSRPGYLAPPLVGPPLPPPYVVADW